VVCLQTHERENASHLEKTFPLPAAVRSENELGVPPVRERRSAAQLTHGG